MKSILSYNGKFHFVELNSTYILKGARLKYTLLPLIFYYVFIKRSFMHTNTYLIQRHSLNAFHCKAYSLFIHINGKNFYIDDITDGKHL